MPAPPASPDARPAAPGHGAGAGGAGGAGDGGHGTDRPWRGRSLAATLLRAPIAGDTWRAYLYLLIGAPLALTAFVTLAIALWVSAVLSIFLVGIALLAATVLGAREYGIVPRALARELLGEVVEAPRRRRPKSPGVLSWLRASLGDLDGWRAIAHIVVSFPVTIVGGWTVVVGTAVAGALFTYPVFWQVVEPTNTDSQGVVRRSGLQLGEFYIDTWPRALAVSAAGLLGLFLMPWVARAFTTVDGHLVRWLLGPTRIGARVDDLEATRAHAVEDSAATLRRIERDLHDGTQARLVALAMHLDMAKEKLGPDGAAGADPDVARARELLDQAHRNATDAITELREVTRSIHPPALDRGLDDALATLAARSGVPARVETRLSVRPSPAIETIAYFCVAELLTNVAKHSRARQALVEVADTWRVVPPAPAADLRTSYRDGVLVLRVTDDGRGGATFVPGGGLAGLAERVRTVDGQLGLSSPPGGPTVATIHLPLGVGP